MTRITALKVSKCSWDTKEGYQDSPWTMVKAIGSAGSPTGRGMDIRAVKYWVRGNLQLYLRGTSFAYCDMSTSLIAPKSKSFSTFKIIANIFHNYPAVILSIVNFPLAFPQRQYSSPNWRNCQFKQFYSIFVKNAQIGLRQITALDLYMPMESEWKMHTYLRWMRK